MTVNSSNPNSQLVKTRINKIITPSGGQSVPVNFSKQLTLTFYDNENDDDL